MGNGAIVASVTFILDSFRRRQASVWLAGVLLATIAWPAPVGGDVVPDEPVAAADAAPDHGFRLRSRLVGDRSSRREVWAGKGLGVGLDVTYSFQGVASGGFDGPAFERLSDEDETGNVASARLQLALDTGKAGLWPGGTFESRLEERVGRSVLQRAGTVSAVDNNALFPNVVTQFDEDALALTKLTVTQAIGGRFALIGGLLDTAEGDENELAGSALSSTHFLNAALLYSLVEDATVPNVALGGGVLFETANVSASVSAFGTEETAGTDPFAHTEGVTFSGEGTYAYTLLARSGAQTLGVLYGIDARRVAIATDPRLGLASVLLGRGLPETSADTWALYYNGHQLLWGDADRGAGLFMRLGVSDGDPNPVRWNWAGGLAGRGLVPRRPDDTWGLGAFYLGLSHADLLKGIDVGDEAGGELFYNVALLSWLHLTLDAQVVDPALPRTETVWVLGVRTHLAL